MIKSESQIERKPLDYVVTYGLWLATSALAVWEISIIRNAVVGFYARFLAPENAGGQGTTYWQATNLSQWAVIILAVFAIGVIIGGFEYHHRRVGEKKSLKVLGYTLGIQLFLLAVALIL